MLNQVNPFGEVTAVLKKQQMILEALEGNFFYDE